MTATTTQLVLLALHWASGLVVLTEALNKLERTAPCRHNLPARERATEWLKAIAWALLAISGAGAIVTPLLPLERPTLQDVAGLLGFAVLIVRTRVKEG